METYKAVMAQIHTLQKKAEQLRRTEIKGVVDRIREGMGQTRNKTGIVGGIKGDKDIFGTRFVASKKPIYMSLSPFLFLAWAQ